MNKAKPVLYIIGGPNGAGKTTSFNSYIPLVIGFINADEIARRIRETNSKAHNVQEIANGLAKDKMNEFIMAKQPFGFESNLADQETWKFIAAIRKDYSVDITFITAPLETCINRVFLRKKEGGHFVKPDIVKSRYIAGLGLLNHYFSLPDHLTIINNESATKPEIVYQRSLNKDLALNQAPEWLSALKSKMQKISSPEQKEKTIDEIRKGYKDRGLSM